jgi:hypothetical protein
MGRNRDVPDLLERFMEESGETRRWVTVNEIRTYFHLDGLSAPAISGFLQRIYHGPFFSCQYRVERIENVAVQKPQRRVIKRYLVTRRPPARQKNLTCVSTRSPGKEIPVIFTDSAAIEHLNRVLLKNLDGNDDSRGY